MVFFYLRLLNYIFVEYYDGFVAAHYLGTSEDPLQLCPIQLSYVDLLYGSFFEPVRSSHSICKDPTMIF